jgi:hypothetical protein
MFSDDRMKAWPMEHYVSWDAIVEAHADAVLSELDNTPAASPEVDDQQNAAMTMALDPEILNFTNKSGSL